MPKPCELVLVMGVAGSGKTTLGQALAEKLRYRFLDADDFHSKQAKQMMSDGIALNDAIREVWLERILKELNALASEQTSCVLAFSGLRAKHRSLLYCCAFTTHAFMLQGESSILATRINQRRDHFMPATLLQDQLNTMEVADKDEGLRILNIAQSPQQLVKEVIAVLAAH